MTDRSLHGADPDTYLPLKPPVFMILLVLAEQESHGYELARRIRDRSDGKIRLETGPLYRHLKRLLTQRLIEETDARRSTDRDDERRRYYRLSRLGHRVLMAEAERLRGLVERIGRIAPSARTSH